jgi:hypothetical protein
MVCGHLIVKVGAHSSTPQPMRDRCHHPSSRAQQGNTENVGEPSAPVHTLYYWRIIFRDENRYVQAKWKS